MPDLGVGLYSLADAARLLKAPRRTLSRWVEGYVQVLRSGEKAYSPVIETSDASILSFGDLVELLYVKGFRDAGVSLDEIRQTVGHFRIAWNESYPLATRKFATNGRNLLLEEGGEWKTALSRQHCAFIEEIGQRLIHLGDLASEWRPLGPEHQVVLNPYRSFGKPIDRESGTHTAVLVQAVEAGDSLESVAWWYGTSTQGISDAIEFECAYGGKRRLTPA